MTDDLAPRQERSRKTYGRLLQATIDILDERGLAEATIPRIAAKAEVAPASVYRRFKDRDALIRAALIEALQSSAKVNERFMRIESFNERTLESVAEALIGLVIKQYQSHPRLIRALIHFVETDGDDAFRERALEIISGNFMRMVEVLMTFRAEIKHANPRRALTFGLLNVATSVEVRTLEEISLWRTLLPITDRELQKELTDSLVTYLRAGGKRKVGRRS